MYIYTYDVCQLADSTSVNASLLAKQYSASSKSNDVIATLAQKCAF